MAKSVKNKKNEFCDLTQKLESHKCYFGGYILDDRDIIYSFVHHFDRDEIDCQVLEKFLYNKKDQILMCVLKILGYYEMEIQQDIGDYIWEQFGDEILKTCNLNSRTTDK